MEKAINVLEIIPDSNVPYYLNKMYKKTGEPVPAFHIYTRYGDSNVPKKENANKDIIKKLWNI